jgi:hypothetical protein
MTTDGPTECTKYRYGRGPTDSPTPEGTSLAKQKDMSEKFEVVQRRGVIKESASPQSSSVVLVRKNGHLRFCADYRKLIDVMKNGCFPLPRTDNTPDTLDGAKWFSTLDLKSGSWQVDLHPDKKKTKFSTVHGLQEFKVMTFGQSMETVLRGLTIHVSCTWT